MLKVLLLDSNHYQMSGLSILISNQLTEQNLGEVCFLSPDEAQSYEDANIIFQDDRVMIQVNKNKTSGLRGARGRRGHEKVVVHVPFITKNQTLREVTVKIGKILNIATSDYNLMASKEDVCWNLGLKKYAQLSDTENNVMMLIGRGYNSSDISRILNRSQKTISTHYRNASRKMGIDNRAEFFRFAAFIANCGRGDSKTLCL